MLRATPFLFKSSPETVVNSIKNAAKAVADTVQGGSAAASKEVNKAAAKDENASVGQRLGAAADAVGDKAKETAHDASAEINKQRAKQ